MIREHGANPKNFKKRSISFNNKLRNDIELGFITQIRVYNTETNEFLSETFDAKVILQLAVSYGDYYVCKLPDAGPPPEVFFTQVQIAKSWKVRQCRIAELGRAELLIPSKKDGKSFLYSKSSIESALQNPTVLAWIKNTSAVDNG